MDDSKTNSVDVESIFKSLCSILWKDVGLSLRELVGFCSNGTSVMTDAKNGSCGKVQTISWM